MFDSQKIPKGLCLKFKSESLMKEAQRTKLGTFFLKNDATSKTKTSQNINVRKWLMSAKFKKLKLCAQG